MSAEHVPERVCAQVGHVMASVFVVRCRHTEAWWSLLTVYRQGAGEPEPIEHVEREWGPFDTPDEIRRDLLVDLAAALARVEHS